MFEVRKLTLNSILCPGCPEVSGGVRARVSGRIPDYQMVSATLLLSERKLRPKMRNPNHWVSGKFSFLQDPLTG